MPVPGENGAFAAAFPGFVLGYFTLGDGPLSTAGDVYLHVALWALGSYAITAALTLVLRLRTSVVMVLLGGGAAALYYWFAADTITTVFALPDTGTLAIRVGALALVATWA